MGPIEGIVTDEANELFEAQTHLYKHAYNYLSSMSLKCAIELGIPDIIHKHGKPITLPELVSVLQLHPTKSSCMRPLLCLLVGNGFLAKTTVKVDEEEEKKEEEAYALTSPSKLLLKGMEPCLSPIVLAFLEPHMLDIWHFSEIWFHENSEANLFESRHGMGIWEFLNENPEKMSAFHESMKADSQMFKLGFKNCKPVFENLGSIVDVGGGIGTLAKIISEEFPNMKCTVLDLPKVVAGLSESKNVSYVSGDMFQSIPHADAVLLKCILHDWNDEQCIKILKNCKEVITGKCKTGKVIIIEMVTDVENDDPELAELKLCCELNMMVKYSGKERSEKEWAKLFSEAGFRKYKISQVFGSKSLIEVYP